MSQLKTLRRRASSCSAVICRKSPRETHNHRRGMYGRARPHCMPETNDLNAHLKWPCPKSEHIMKALTVSTFAILLGVSGAALAQSSSSGSSGGTGSSSSPGHTMQNSGGPGSDSSRGASSYAPGHNDSDATGSINNGSPSHSNSSNGTSGSSGSH
jgi:hypothetical protein